MRLTLRVRYPDFVITRVDADMASHPYTICPEVLPPLHQLVGLSGARGFTRAVNERFVNTCPAWREHGRLHEQRRARDRDGLRALSARPTVLDMPTPRQ
jgi:hypothetical protein